jgi:hypothetical protein
MSETFDKESHVSKIVEELPEEEEYTEEEYRKALRYPLGDEQLIIEVAKTMAYLRKRGYPAVMAHAGVKDPRFLIFLEALMSEKYDNIVEFSMQRLGLSKPMLKRWFNFLKSEGYLPQHIVDRYAPQVEALDGKGKKAEKSGKDHASIRLQPTPVSDERREKEFIEAKPIFRVKDMAKEDVSIGELERQYGRTIEMDEDSFIRLVYGALVGDKRAIAESLQRMFKEAKSFEDAVKMFLGQYGPKLKEMESKGLVTGAVDVDRAIRELLDYQTYLAKLSMFWRMTGTPFDFTHGFGMNPGFNPAASMIEEKIKRLEEQVQKAIEEIRKREEEDKYRRLEERISELAKLLESGGRKVESEEVKELKEKLRQYEDERRLNEFAKSISDSIRELKESLVTKTSGTDVLDAIAKFDTMLKDREARLRELEEKLRAERDERMLSQVENLRSEIQELRRLTSEVAKDPFRAFTEFANRLEELERTITSIRKGSTPTVEASMKERVMGLLENIATKITEATLSKGGPAAPAVPGVKLSAVPCPNPSCGKPIPLPTTEGVDTVTCPSCGSTYKLVTR